mgnify:CR=1 FL=1
MDVRVADTAVENLDFDVVDARLAALEAELKELGNSIGMGAMGFVGKSIAPKASGIPYLKER